MNRSMRRVGNYTFRPWLALAILLAGLTTGCSPAVGSFSAADLPATLTPVKASTKIVANGFVLPRRKAALGFPVSGTVAEVYAARGAAVQAGQVIARLDGTQQDMAVAQAQARLQVAEANLAALRAGAQPQEILAAEAAVESAQANVDRLEQGPRPEDVRGAEAKVAEAEAALQRVLDGSDPDVVIAAEARASNALAALQVAQAAYDRVSALPDIGARAESAQLQQATNDYQAAQAQLAALLKGASAATIAEAHARLQWAQAQLDAVRAPPRTPELMAARADVQAATAQLELLQSKPTPDAVAAAEAEVALAQALLAQAEYSLEQMTLRAPMTGTVVTLDAVVGEFITAGAPVVQIADLTDWAIETDDLTELNVTQLKPGLPVVIGFDALPQVTLSGVIEDISLQGTEKTGDILYTVVIRPDQHNDQLRWGMSAVLTFSP
jgi:multidrug resistance efflux pump